MLINIQFNHFHLWNSLDYTYSELKDRLIQLYYPFKDIYTSNKKIKIRERISRIRKVNKSNFKFFYKLRNKILVKKSKKDSDVDIALENILTLNLYQYVILFFLSIQPSETIRYSLLQDINKYVFPQAKLSPASFYNTLDRLEKLGLVEMTQSNNGRVKSVKGTSKIKQVLQIIGQYGALLSFNPEIIFGEYLPIFENYIKLGKVKSILFIDLDEFFDVGFTSLLKEHSEEFYLLADNESFEKYQSRTSQQMFQTQVLNGKIREPDKIFDVVFIVDFCIKDDFYGMNTKSLLQEALRVTRSNGLVIIHGQDEFPTTNNFILDSMVKNFQNNPFVITIKEETFTEVITSVSPFEPEFYNSNGFLIAKIKVS